MTLANTPEVKYQDNYNETSGTITTSVELVYKYPTAKTLSQVQSDVYEWVRENPKDFGNRRCSAISITQDENSLGNVWTARVEYSTRPRQSSTQTQQYPKYPGCIPESFSSTGGTAHVVNAYSETAYHRDGVSTPPSMYGGIMWDGERFAGCDIVVPTFEFTLQRTYDYDNVTAQVKTMWANSTGCVNNDTFHGYDAGTVLFCGISGSTRTEYEGDTFEDEDGNVWNAPTDYVDVTYHFRCSPNMPQFTIGGIQVSKMGWQYAWVFNSLEDSEGHTIERPLAAYVDDVYRYISFANIIL